MYLRTMYIFLYIDDIEGCLKGRRELGPCLKRVKNV